MRHCRDGLPVDRARRRLRVSCSNSSSWPLAISMVSNWSIESTKILPSPIRPVRAMSTILRMISSARASSTHREISTFGQEGQRVLAVAVLVQVALLAAKPFDLADRQGLQGGPAQTLQDLSARNGLTIAVTCFTAARPRYKVRCQVLRAPRVTANHRTRPTDRLIVSGPAGNPADRAGVSRVRAAFTGRVLSGTIFDTAAHVPIIK